VPFLFNDEIKMFSTLQESQAILRPFFCQSHHQFKLLLLRRRVWGDFGVKMGRIFAKFRPKTHVPKSENWKFAEIFIAYLTKI
jgi:hypothetical protein